MNQVRHPSHEILLSLGQLVISPSNLVGKGMLVAAIWSTVAGLLTFQGWLTGYYAGDDVPLWPAFTYSLAVSSVWAAMTPSILAFGRRLGRLRLSLIRVALILAASYCATAIVHVSVFSLLFWPFYGMGQHENLLAMGSHMIVRNVGLNAIFFGVLVGVGRLMSRTSSASAALGAGHKVVTTFDAGVTPESASDVARAPAPVLAPDPTPDPAPDPAPDQSSVPVLGPTESVSLLRSSSRGRVRIVKLSSIRWLRAAGNYSEAVTDEGVILMDESLAILSRRLPPETFARVHRTAIVRLASVKEVRSRGHGDADLVLEGGEVVRMSRRYRSGLAELLGAR